MSALKNDIINYVLKLLATREREMRTDDVKYFVYHQFSRDIDEGKQTDNMYVDSICRELQELYGMIAFYNEGRTMGLTMEGYRAAEHPLGISGYMSDLRRKEERKERIEIIEKICSIVGGVIAVIASVFDFMVSNVPSLTKAVMFAAGFLSSILLSRLMRGLQMRRSI